MTLIEEKFAKLSTDHAPGQEVRQPLVREDLVVLAGDTVRVSLFMRPAAFQLAEVTVTPGSFSVLDAGPANVQTLSRTDIESAPFGEDLFRAVNRLPGLTSGDYGAQFSIRGGRADETLLHHSLDYCLGDAALVAAAAESLFQRCKQKLLIGLLGCQFRSEHFLRP